MTTTLENLRQTKSAALDRMEALNNIAKKKKIATSAPAEKKSMRPKRPK